jgi:F0F1-type ATP synthase assembly protein I
MDEDLADLDRKIRQARGGNSLDPAQEKRRSDSLRDKAGMQAGMEFVLCIALSTFLGYHADRWAGTSPLFLILLFFLGVMAGFWSLYKFSRKVGSGTGFSQLRGGEKRANKAPDNDLTPL